MLSSRGSSWPRDQTRISCVSCISGRFFTAEPLEKPPMLYSRSLLSILYRVVHISERAMATHSSTLAWKLPWRMEEPGRPQSKGPRRVGHDWTTSLSLSCIGEGNSNPLQCSCLENPRDGGAWWTAVYGVTQIWTRLKRLSSSSSSTYMLMLYYKSSP